MGEDIRRVGGFDRAAVEQAHFGAFCTKAVFEVAAQGGVDVLDLVRGRCEACSDGPDRLVGDRGIRRRSCIGNGAVHLLGQDLKGFACAVLGFGLADAEQDVKARGPAGLGLGCDICVRLVVVGAAFGVAGDDVSRACVLKHFGRYVACVGAGLVCVAIFTAHMQARRGHPV